MRLSADVCAHRHQMRLTELPSAQPPCKVCGTWRLALSLPLCILHTRMLHLPLNGLPASRCGSCREHLLVMMMSGDGDVKDLYLVPVLAKIFMGSACPGEKFYGLMFGYSNNNPNPDYNPIPCHIVRLGPCPSTVRGKRSAALQGELEDRLTEVVRSVNERKDHIPPVVSPATVTFPFEIALAGCAPAGWSAWWVQCRLQK